MNMMLQFVTNGTYVMAKYDADTCKKIHQWAEDNHIPAPLPEDKLHSTIIESRAATIPDHESLNREISGMSFKAQQLLMMPTRFKSLSGQPEKALIIMLEAPQLVELHKEMIARGGKHSRDEYDPHIAISYFVPVDTDLRTIPLPTFPMHVSNIVAEPIDVDWINH